MATFRFKKKIFFPDSLPTYWDFESVESHKRRKPRNRARNTTDMKTAREHGNQVPMRDVHARQKPYTMRVAEHRQRH